MRSRTAGRSSAQVRVSISLSLSVCEDREGGGWRSGEAESGRGVGVATGARQWERVVCGIEWEKSFGFGLESRVYRMRGLPSRFKGTIRDAIEAGFLRRRCGEETHAAPNSARFRGLNGCKVYFDYMRSFRVEFDEFFEDGIISAVEVGLGPCGELRYPSYSVKNGWRYPGIGEFQCYDQYLIKSLRKAAEARGHSFWARGPENAGSYNSRPQETAFFCDDGDYDGYYGRFFLGWYSQLLVDHADRVLSLAKLAFEGTCIVAKISGVYWWYKTASHAAELTAGFYNPCNRDGYASIASMLKRHFVTLNLCSELRTSNHQAGFSEALADPEGLIWQVLNAAWDVSIPVASVNSFPCYDRDSYNKILENAKPLDDPDGRHLSSFTYLRLSPVLMEGCNFSEFERFVKRMHGEAVLDL